MGSLTDLYYLGSVKMSSTNKRHISHRIVSNTFGLILTLPAMFCADANVLLENQSYSRHELALGSKQDPADFWLRAQDYVIASDAAQASQAAAKMLNKKGNVIDAAIALSFAISVVRPQSTGLGGGGFLLFHLNGKTRAFDFRERAPLKAHAKMYTNTKPQASLFGPKAVAVPGMIAGLIQIHRLYGKLKLATVLAPAIHLAEAGFRVYPDLEKAIAAAYNNMDPVMAKVFSVRTNPASQTQKQLKTGDLLLQKDLGKTLRLLTKEGERAFYHGKIGQDLAAFMKKTGGLISLKDLQNYQVLRPKPLWSSYRGLKIATMPLPSSGIFLIGMLKRLEAFPLASLYAKQRKSYYNVLIQALHHGFQDRARYGGDSRFLSVNTAKLLKPSPLSSAPHTTTKQSQKEKKSRESYETTHFSLIDRQGNAVVSTQSINYRFGARLMLPNWGIILNDTMDDFSAAPGKPNVYGLVGGKANAIAANKTPLSSMSPTLFFDKDGVRLAVGAPGGSQIISAILQTIIHDIDLKMHPFATVARRRIHHQYKPETVFIEPQALSHSQKKQLEKHGYQLQVKPLQAKVFFVKRDKQGLIGACDPRGSGRPAGSNSEYRKQNKTTD